jgi:hypothetical protein
MEQHPLAGLHGKAAVQQVLHGHALQEHRRGLLVADPVGYLDQPACRQVAQVGVGPGRAAGIGHPVAHLDLGDVRSHRLDHARRLAAETAGHLQGVVARAVIDVQIVQSNRALADQGLAGRGRP